MTKTKEILNCAHIFIFQNWTHIQLWMCKWKAMKKEDITAILVLLIVGYSFKTVQ